MEFRRQQLALQTTQYGHASGTNNSHGYVRPSQLRNSTVPFASKKDMREQIPACNATHVQEECMNNYGKVLLSMGLLFLGSVWYSPTYVEKCQQSSMIAHSFRGRASY
jgi:hypothetical protein